MVDPTPLFPYKYPKGTREEEKEGKKDERERARKEDEEV
jgi:hypothetical protein